MLTLLVACNFTQTPTPTPEPPPGPKDLTACFDSDHPNIYQAVGSDSIVGLIYQQALLDPSANLFNLEQLPNVQLEAFLRLVEVAQQWTTYADIPVNTGGVNNQDFVRITVTFLSPELIKMVLLNHYLGEIPTSKDIFIENVNKRISYFENRKEIVFLVTLTSSYYNPSITDPDVLQISADVNEIKLFDTNGNLISLRHYDPPLGQSCCVSRGHISGYISYPMFVYRNKKCTATLNRDYATTMTLKVGNFIINGNESSPLILTLRYHSLLELEDSHTLDPAPILGSGALIEPRTKTSPPMPALGVNSPDFLYWQNMASYIWWYLSAP